MYGIKSIQLWRLSGGISLSKGNSDHRGKLQHADSLYSLSHKVEQDMRVCDEVNPHLIRIVWIHSNKNKLGKRMNTEGSAGFWLPPPKGPTAPLHQDLLGPRACKFKYNNSKVEPAGTVGGLRFHPAAHEIETGAYSPVNSRYHIDSSLYECHLILPFNIDHQINITKISSEEACSEATFCDQVERIFVSGQIFSMLPRETPIGGPPKLQGNQVQRKSVCQNVWLKAFLLPQTTKMNS
ncbi:hypothetical protein B0H11DRAFT_1940684 [Mycena galericulata]|nr:hypothetical protein B0H11DRAFT_1940684 [Mycena galericulata]